jgi:polyisoprenyl-teichoic acid--peptidoglycan teichoic acid transferase
VISTNLPASELDRFVSLALKAKSQPLTTVSFVPPLVNTAAPDIPLVQERVQAAIERSRSRGDGETVRVQKKKGPPAGGGGAPSAPSTGGSVGSLAEGYAANDAADLSDAC